MIFKKCNKIILAFILFCSSGFLFIRAEPLTIFAAASTTHIVKALIQQYQQQHPIKIQTSFASSGTLAKQIIQGAPAHIFLSANALWMDHLEQQQLLVPQSRFNLFYNRLVLITPKDQFFEVHWSHFDLPAAFQGPFSLGDPAHSPAGIYAKEALQYFNWWVPLQSRAILTHTVLATLAYVERGEVALGIVYATDAKISKSVKIAGYFPEKSHPPIVYPIALIAENQTATAQQFMSFLKTPEARNLYQHYGFKVK